MSLLLLANAYALYLAACAATLALSAYAYWRTMRAWPAETRIFGFALGCSLVLAWAAAWAVGLPGLWPAGAILLAVFGFFIAGGAATGAVFAQLAWQDYAPGAAVRRWLARIGAGGEQQ